MLISIKYSAYAGSIGSCLSLLFQRGLLEVVSHARSGVLFAGLAVGLCGRALFGVEAGNLILGLADVLHGISKIHK